jgi:hypothetical protein
MPALAEGESLYVSTALARGSRAATSQSVTSWSSPAKQGYVPQKGTDYKDGLDGKETYSGFAYHTSITLADKPNPPTSGTYTFAVGSTPASVSIGGSWSPNPPTLSGATSANIYYCQWTATRSSSTATTANLVFGLVFKGTQFDGLVTFTAIASELASNTTGRKFTSIHGGNIETGTIVVDKLTSGKNSIRGASNFSFGLGTNSVMKDGTNDRPLAAAVIGEASGTSSNPNGNHGVLGHSADAAGVVASTFSQNGHGAVQAYCSNGSHKNHPQTSCHLATKEWAIAGSGNGYVTGTFLARNRTVVTEVSFSGGVLSLKGSNQT